MEVKVEFGMDDLKLRERWRRKSDLIINDLEFRKFRPYLLNDLLDFFFANLLDEVRFAAMSA